MTKIFHLNCVKIESPMGSAIGHCLLIEENGQLVLIDAGIGLIECREPEKRLGKDLIEVTGFKFDERLTAVRQIKDLGFRPDNVKDIVCSHLDPDHIGGLADFPHARIHVSKEEFESFNSGDIRYLPQQLLHNPSVELYKDNDSVIFGLPARKVDTALDISIHLIPLFGHTLGHCGVVVETKTELLFYTGDAYYLRAELNDRDHPVNDLATIRAVDNKLRLESVEKVRNVVKNYGDSITYFGYHDPSEF